MWHKWTIKSNTSCEVSYIDISVSIVTYVSISIQSFVGLYIYIYIYIYVYIYIDVRFWYQMLSIVCHGKRFDPIEIELLFLLSSINHYHNHRKRTYNNSIPLGWSNPLLLSLTLIWCHWYFWIIYFSMISFFC